MRKKIPKVRIGDEYFRVGLTSEMARAAAYVRDVLRGRYETLLIVGQPTHWAEATWKVETFKGPETKILEAVIQSTVTIGKKPYDVEEALKELGAKEGEDLLPYAKAIDIHYVKDTAITRVHYDHELFKPGAAISMKKLYLLARAYGAWDGVIRYIYAQGENGFFFLWVPMARRKVAGIWDTWSEEINKFHLHVYGKLKAVGSLDVLAIHQDENWMMHKYKIEQAFKNALMNVDNVKDKLWPLVAGKKAEGLIYERAEERKVPPERMKVKKLFVPVTEEEKEGE